jgi:SPP1 family predicted phage head-tail adaptor
VTPEYNAGDYTERIELYSRGASTLDAHGQDTITWTLNGTFWAQVVPMSAREVFAAQQVVAEQTLKFRIRHHATVSASWRLVWQGRNHDITSVLPFGGRKDRTEILCVQGVKDGR